MLGPGHTARRGGVMLGVTESVEGHSTVRYTPSALWGLTGLLCRQD